MSVAALKDQIQQLKQITVLKPIKVAKGPNPPFPIHFYMLVMRPESASMFDMENLQIELECRDIGSVNLKLSSTDHGFPVQLTERIQANLLQFWQTKLTDISWGLLELYEYATLNFAKLVSLMPECLERYQSTNEHGASIRRVAIIIRINI
jgi:hypothetical protein